MNIAVVGGGTRCKRLMEVIERHTFEEIDPRIVAVADINDQAPGLLKAKKQGLYVTGDYNDFLGMNDIDLIIELMGSTDIYNDILSKKKRNVRAVSDKTAQLFWEISRISTKQKRTDQKLQETRVMYRTLINELIQEEVLVIADDYKILDANETLLEKLGLKREEVIGRHCYEITHHQDLPCSGDHHPCPLIQTLKTHKPFQTTHVHLDKDGKEIYYSISTYPLLEKGKVTGAIELSRDITKEINYQKVMMNQEKMASIGRLSAGVAHEINNPLTTILTTTMLIQEDLDPEDPNYEDLQTVVTETLRCRKIVTSLLDFARQTKPAKKTHDLNKIIKECITLTRKQAAFKDVMVAHDLYDALPPLLLDKGQFEQVFINLILNAVEANPPGGEVVITSRCSKDNQVAEIIVSDTGTGIPEDNIDKIFDPFFTTKESGTGLGLAIIHGIVEQHDGMIAVENMESEGTAFIIRLPYGGDE